MAVEQLSAVLAAPIPFFIAVVVIAWAAWRAWQWRFKAVFEKQRELYDLSRLEVNRWKTDAERTAKELTEKIALLEEQQNLTVEAKKQLGSAKDTVLKLTAQLNRLGEANRSMQLGIWTGPTNEAALRDWTSSELKPRYPTDITGRSA